MKLSKERKVYVVVFGLAVVGMLADRVFLGTDASSPAGAEAQTLIVPPEERQAASEAGNVHAKTMDLASYLQELAETNEGIAEVPDAFACQADWAKPPSMELLELGPDNLAEKFKETHRLTAISAIEGGTPIAVINGRVYSVGSTVSDRAEDEDIDTGIRLVSVDKSRDRSTAVLESNGIRVELVLE